MQEASAQTDTWTEMSFLVLQQILMLRFIRTSEHTWRLEATSVYGRHSCGLLQNGGHLGGMILL